MSSRIIRILSAALVVLLAWACLAATSLVPENISDDSYVPPAVKPRIYIGTKDGRPIRIYLPVQGKVFDEPYIAPAINPLFYPGSNETQLMQISLDTLRLHQIEQRKKAGEIIKYGKIAVTSRPEGAKLYVSSFVYYGRTPYTKIELLPGAHRVTVRKEGYYEQVRMAKVAADQTIKLDFTLKPIPYAQLTVEAVPRHAKVSVIGVPREYAPGMKLEPGEYLIRVSQSKNREHRLWTVLKPNEKLTLKASLLGRLGKLKVTAKQPGTTVYLDGQEAGSAPLTISGLLPGPHKLQVWKSLFKPTTKLVQVRAAETVAEHIDLGSAEHFTNSLGMEFVKIPAGSFMMGHRDFPEIEARKALDPPGDDLARLGSKLYGLYEEYPRHLVAISEPFFIQTTEITKGQWLEVMGENFDYDMSQRDHPMVVNSFKEVQAFLEKLNQRENGKIYYQLPSEAQWEYAARAGTTSPFFTGENVGPNQANFNGEWPYNNVINGVFRKVYTKVKSFPPNPWGLFDTIGNAYEICADGYDYFFYPRSPIVDPRRGEMEHNMLTGRGGSYDRGLERCTAASRVMMETVGPSATYLEIGIRLIAQKIQGK